MPCLYWTSAEVEAGKTLKVRSMCRGYKLKLFRVPVSAHRTAYPVTNEVAPCDTAAAESSVRWTIESFHRVFEQLPGVQACRCRLARSQRNHIALAVRAWARLKQGRLPHETGRLSTQTRLFGRVYAT